MKTKGFIALLSVLLLLSGCGSSASTTTGTTPVQTETPQEKTDDLADLMSVQEYACTVDDTFMYYVLYITNGSDKVVSADMNVTALDDTGAEIAAHSDDTRAIAPGQTAGIWTTFDEWDKIVSFEYSLSVAEEKDFSPAYDDLTVNYNATDDGVTASVTNNGSESASFVWIDVVYLKDGKMVNFSELSCMNDGQELPAGATISDQGVCYYEDGFDDVAIAVNCRR